jgi:hypothetical protein
MTKQALITMSNEEALEDEGRTKPQKDRRRSRNIIWQSFLLGSSIGVALQVMSYMAYHTLLKMFGKNTNPTPGSLLSSFSYYLLVLITQLTWLTVMYFSTKSGSLYMRKKFDKDAANPNSGSIWTTRMITVVGVYFLTGATIGSVSLRVGVALYIGMMIPWMTLFRSLMIDCGTLLLAAKWFDWSHPIEQELEDDHSCIV